MYVWIILAVALLAYTSIGNTNNDMIIFGYDAKPPKYWVENEQDKGILVDMIMWIGKEMDYRFDIRLYPWNRAYKNALEGKGAIIGFSKNKERLEIFDYSDVMYYDDILLVVRKGKKFSFGGMEDLKGKVIAVNGGVSYGDEYDYAKKNYFEAFITENHFQRL